MQRDDDYLRDLLLEMEASEGHCIMIELYIGASNEDQKRYHHTQLLCDAGFFQEVERGTYRMTNQGHDYLESIRDNKIWDKTKAGAAKIGGATLNIMQELAVAYLKQEAKSKLGIALS